MSRIPMSDEAPLPFDGHGDCKECGAALTGAEDFEDVCMNCDTLSDPMDDDDELFGTPATRRGTGGAAFTERQREDAEDFS